MWQRKDDLTHDAWHRESPPMLLKVERQAFNEPEWGKPRWSLIVTTPFGKQHYHEYRSYQQQDALDWANRVAIEYGAKE